MGLGKDERHRTTEPEFFPFDVRLKRSHSCKDLEALGLCVVNCCGLLTWNVAEELARILVKDFDCARLVRVFGFGLEDENVARGDDREVGIAVRDSGDKAGRDYQGFGLHKSG